MRATRLVVLNLVFVLLAAAAFASAITPTTTLSAETGNNTSAASSFQASRNGNAGASNVSKVDHRTLLYPGATTPIYTNIMYWFGPSNHIQIGYNSGNVTQIHKQVDDHVSRGLAGTIVDWYGVGHSFDNNATIEMMKYAETLPGYPFKFAIMEDKGALLSCANTAGCDLNQQLVSDLSYIYKTFAGSPAYITMGGRPVVFFFGLERFTLDWAYVKANAPGGMLYIFENQSAFTNIYGEGGYSWVHTNKYNPDDWARAYIDSFYSTAEKYTAKYNFGATWKGFNDAVASWSLNRIMNQNCGQVWLATWDEIKKFYSAGNQLDALQIVTWNDYEEGTEIETGIENCVAVSGDVNGAALNWSLTSGSENTIDHYEVFASLDGENLARLASVSAGIRTLDLAQFTLDPGSYTLYVKAVGKPSILNKMSAPISYTVADQGPQVALNVTPSSGIAPVTVAATANATAQYGSVSTFLDFGDGTARVSGATATHIYATPGTYTVTATATDSFGKTATTSTTVTVIANQPPQATLSVAPATGVAPVTVTASTAGSTDADGGIASSSIDFGDGTTAAGPIASHMYASSGTYQITATVTDDRGSSSRATTTVTVAAPGITVSQPVNGSTVSSPVRFVASTTAPTGRVITAMKIYVDGQSLYSASVSALDTAIVMAPGLRNISINAWDNAGAVYVTKMTLNVLGNNPPSAAITVTPTSTTVGTVVAATLTGSDSDGTISSYSIDFGDGYVVSGTSGSHAYKVAGSYTVRGTVTDNQGKSTTATKTVTVLAAEATLTGVTVLSPAQNATVSSPVRVVASAAAPAGRTITHMRIYVDTRAAYDTSASKIDTYVAVSRGTHTMNVQAWDNTGAVYKVTRIINVR